MREAARRAVRDDRCGRGSLYLEETLYRRACGGESLEKKDCEGPTFRHGLR